MKNLILHCLILFIFVTIKSQDINFTLLPAQFQLFPRDTDNSALVTFAGNVITAGFDSIVIKKYINNILDSVLSYKLTYNTNNAPFELSYSIYADTVLYKFVVLLTKTGETTVENTIDSIVCGDMFLVDGQSNAVATNGGSVQTDKFLRSFGILNENYSNPTPWVSYNPADTLWGLAWNGNPGYFGVGAWEYEMMKKLKETFGIPIGMINGAGSGSPIILHLKNLTDPLDLDSSAFYGKMLYRAFKAHVAGKVKAIFWNQGEADDVAGNTLYYYTDFKTMHDQWMGDYPNVKYVFLFQINLLGTNCGNNGEDDGSAFREVQRSIPDSLSNCREMSQVGLPGHDGCHYSPAGYQAMGDWIYGQVAQELYNYNFGYNAGPPNILNAMFTSANKDNIAIKLTNKENVVVHQNLGVAGIQYYISDMFYLDGVSGQVTGVYSSNDTIYLILNGPCSASQLTYLPNAYYPGTSNFYNGPWVMGTNGTGMLTFNNTIIGCPNDAYPVLNAATITKQGSFSPGTIVGSIKATSPIGDSLFYSITLGNTNNTFTIDSLTGVLSILNTPKYQQYLLGIKVHDNGFCKLATTSDFIINCIKTTFNEASVDDPLKIFPNPNNGSFQVLYESNTQGDIVLKLYDLTGREVFEFSDFKTQVHYSKQITVNNYHGMYMLYLYDKDKVTVTKIIIE